MTIRLAPAVGWVRNAGAEPSRRKCSNQVRNQGGRQSVETLSEFFSTLPDVFSALWTFGRGWSGVLISGGSLVLFAVLCFAAMTLRETHGWVAAILGMMGATIAAWWAFGILPSAWIYFADGQRDLMQDQVIPGTIAFGDFVVASNFYVVFRDLVTVTLNGIALVG